MLTTATQQRNSQGNLQGNPQSETPPISIETNPIAPIIDAARIFSLRFTARIKRIGAILIMSALMVFLAACEGGGGDDGNGGGGDGGAQSVDIDGDGVRNNVDVDADGDGLIEIATAQQLNQTRYNLQGSSLKINARDTGDANGCGGQDGITACNGYELTNDISLAGYADWQPIGSCPTFNQTAFACTDTAVLFNATFHGNGRTISNLTITNPAGTSVNGSGLFGAISPDSVLRNINIRSASINGSANGVGMLVGYAREATIRDSSVEGEIDVTGRIVGGLVGFGIGSTITGSSATGDTVSGVSEVGGLVGWGYNATITGSSANIDTVSGGDDVGGLVGSGESINIISSFAKSGIVSGTGDRTGGLIGSGDDATITLSSAESGIVRGDSADVGGLVGLGQRANIISSFAKSGNVSGTRDVGGLVGGGWLVNITSSYAESENVHGNSDVSTNLNHSIGGLVGNGYNSDITSSYAVSETVSGSDRIGGLIGYGEEATVNSSYAISMAVNGASELGGLVGQGNDNTAITASYWDGAVTISGSSGSSYGLPKTTAELQAPAHATGIYATWSSLCPGINRPVWYFGNSTQYPVLTCHPNSDSDRDGVPDIIDTDDDNDGTLDTADALPLNPTEDTDTDNDGVGDNADAFPRNPVLSAFAVSELRATPGAGNVTLSWNNPNNPDVQIASIDISYKRTGTDDAPMTISSSKTTSGATNVEETITGLTNGQSYTFTVSLTLIDPDAGMVGPAQSISAAPNPFAVTGLYGVAGTDYVTLSWTNPDAQIESISISYEESGSGNSEDAPLITDSPKIDANETVQHNISGLMTGGVSYDFTVSLILSGPDAGKEGVPPTIRNILVDADYDNDGENNFVDVDADGNGLIEIATAQQLDQSRHNLLGSSFKSSAGGVGDANGCGNGGSVTECNGYELIADIYLTTYANWQPIGRCMNYNSGLITCSPTTQFFNAIFDGNNHTINDLTITNHDGSYDNASGLFGAISSTSILRNIHIRSGNISDGGRNVGLLVGYAQGASIINSSAEGAVDASGNNVGGLVGDGRSARITSSYAVGGAVSGDGNNVGGLVGYGFESIITSSYAAGGDVSGTGNDVGGLVGDGDGATITSSYAAGGAVSGDRRVGGLVGDGGSSMTITSSYAAGGAVSGDGNSVGGLVGSANNGLGGAEITSSYAAGGAVSGGFDVGGLVGFGLYATITSSYAAGGDVSGTGNDVGGLVGDGLGAIITSSYAAGGAVSGTGSDVGGLVGGGEPTEVTASYWDDAVTITPSAGNNHGLPKTTSELQAPVHATGIYATWTSLCPGANKPAWYFGNSTQYPVLTCHPNSDSDRDGVPDIIDTDDDNDGILDTADDLPLNPTEDTDTDNDGVGNNTDAFPSDPNESMDTDDDTVGDNADAFPEDPTEDTDTDGDGVGNNTDAFPSDPNESVDTDGDGVGDNADACDGVGAATGWTSDATTDKDGDGCRDSDEDVDDNGNGLIEIATPQQLDQIQHNLQGSSFKISDTDAGDSAGCGGQDGITACNGYELTQNISLTAYTNWLPIGRCSTPGTTDTSSCTPVNRLFNAIFDGNNHTINDLTITNPPGSYANAAGLFGAISSDSILRNIHIRSANLIGGEDKVGLLVGYARGAMIINSSAEGAVTASGFDVGGLVGDGRFATITSSYAAGGNVSGNERVGGLVGDGRFATITSSYAAGGNVSGTGNEVGGLVGNGDSANITSSYAAGGDVSGGFDVRRGFDVGGLVGRGQEATITSSYAAGGTVNGTNDYVGGLVGWGQEATITSSYAAGGAVIGDDNVGGLVGEGFNATITSSYAAGGAVSGIGDTDLDLPGNNVGGLVGNGSDATIMSSYAAGGAVSGDGNEVGGLVGDGGGATITFSYWDSEKGGQESSQGGIGKTTEELKTPTSGDLGIYSTWASGSSGTCADGTTPTWNFGTASEYPALNCTPNGFLPQRRQR